MPISTTPSVNPFITIALALACLAAAPLAQASELTPPGTITTASLMQHCTEMQTQRQQLMADQQSQDTALTEQVTAMNRAAESQKLGLLAAVVTRMSAQRIAQDAQRMKMGEQMMQHLMQHLQMGGDSLSGCPMMKATMAMRGSEDHLASDRQGAAPTQAK